MWCSQWWLTCSSESQGPSCPAAPGADSCKKVKLSCCLPHSLWTGLTRRYSLTRIGAPREAPVLTQAKDGQRRIALRARRAWPGTQACGDTASIPACSMPPGLCFVLRSVRSLVWTAWRTARLVRLAFPRTVACGCVRATWIRRATVVPRALILDDVRGRNAAGPLSFPCVLRPLNVVFGHNLVYAVRLASLGFNA